MKKLYSMLLLSLITGAIAAQSFTEIIGTPFSGYTGPAAFADIVWGVFAGLVLLEDTKKGLEQGKDLLRPTLELALEIISRGIKRD